MTNGIVLLSQDGFYLTDQGTLPSRPSFDKELLISLTKGARILCSHNTLVNLPKSITSIAKSFTTNPDEPWDLNFGISTFEDAYPDVMYVVKSDLSCIKGKEFRLDGFKACYSLAYDAENLSIYFKKENCNE